MKNKLELQMELTRYIADQLQKKKDPEVNQFVNCPTLFDNKEMIIKLIIGLSLIGDTMFNAFQLIQRIIVVRDLFRLENLSRSKEIFMRESFYEMVWKNETVMHGGFFPRNSQSKVLMRVNEE